MMKENMGYFKLPNLQQTPIVLHLVERPIIKTKGILVSLKKSWYPWNPRDTHYISWYYNQNILFGFTP